MCAFIESYRDGNEKEIYKMRRNCAECSEESYRRQEIVLISWN